MYSVRLATKRSAKADAFLGAPALVWAGLARQGGVFERVECLERRDVAGVLAHTWRRIKTVGGTSEGPGEGP